MFLNDDELARLTGRRQKKRQITQLRLMGLPFFVNAAGAPVVARSAVEGIPTTSVERPSPPRAWQPSLVKATGGR